jgi:hypothetical protein
MAPRRLGLAVRPLSPSGAFTKQPSAACQAQSKPISASYSASLLRAQGYRQVRVVGGPGDLQADIIARDAQGRRVVAQCKQYAPANRIGSPMIQTFIGMVHVHHKAQIGIFVTTSSYTDAALAACATAGWTAGLVVSTQCGLTAPAMPLFQSDIMWLPA